MAFQMLEMSDPQDGISENGTLKRWSRAAVPSFKTSCVTSWRWERTSECRGCDRCKGLGHPAVAKPWVGRWFIPLFKRNRHKDDECRHVVLFGKINHQKDCKDFGGSATSESPSWYSQFFPFAKKGKKTCWGIVSQHVPPCLNRFGWCPNMFPFIFPTVLGPQNLTIHHPGGWHRRHRGGAAAATCRGEGHGGALHRRVATEV